MALIFSPYTVASHTSSVKADLCRLTDSATVGFADSRFSFHHSDPIPTPIFNDVIMLMLSVDQIKVTSLILILILDNVFGDIAQKIFVSCS